MVNYVIIRSPFCDNFVKEKWNQAVYTEYKLYLHIESATLK
jgi:Ni,Fe-hydrogenase I cytochrome b subunit